MHSIELVHYRLVMMLTAIGWLMGLPRGSFVRKLLACVCGSLVARVQKKTGGLLALAI